MSGRRTDESLAGEAARRRKELRDEQARHEQTLGALRAANRQLLQLALRDRLRDPGDFEIFVGIDQVVDDSGRIDWVRVNGLVDTLLEMRPHLVAPPR